MSHINLLGLVRWSPPPLSAPRASAEDFFSLAEHLVRQFPSSPSSPSSPTSEHLRSFDQRNIALKIEPQSLLTFQVALTPNVTSQHLPPSKITLDAWEEDDTDDDEDDDPEAQYITIYPGSPFHKPTRASHCPSAESSSNSESSSPCISPSISALPSDSFLQISPVSPESPRTLRVLYCQEFSRAVRFDPAIEFDESCLETMEDTLLLEPQKVFEKVCIASLWRNSSRHPVDVPVDLSDDDDEWELWDSRTNGFATLRTSSYGA